MNPLVFAYGSNLDVAQMRARCPGARAESSAVINGYRLAFGGYSHSRKGAVATIEWAPAARVEGLLYRLPREELALLDRYEGAPFLYARATTTVRDITGHRRRVHVYHLRHAPPGTPAIDYLQQIFRAYQRLGFDRRALFAAAYRSSPCASSSTDRSYEDSKTTDTSRRPGSCVQLGPRASTRS